MLELGSTQRTTKRDLFLFSLFKYKMFLDLHESTQRGRETFCTTGGARAGHLGFVDGDPLKGGNERCREVEAGVTVSRTVAGTAT